MTSFQLKSLSEVQRERLLDVPVYITLYVGVADGTLDREEIEWSEHIAEFRAQQEDDLLGRYWSDVDRRFRRRFFQIRSELGVVPDKEVSPMVVMQQIEAWFRGIPSAYPSLPEGWVVELYESWRTYARQVARASGGILGFGAVSGKEERAILKIEKLLAP